MVNDVLTEAHLVIDENFSKASWQTRWHIIYIKFDGTDPNRSINLKKVEIIMTYFSGISNCHVMAFADVLSDSALSSDCTFRFSLLYSPELIVECVDIERRPIVYLWRLLCALKTAN